MDCSPGGILQHVSAAAGNSRVTNRSTAMAVPNHKSTVDIVRKSYPARPSRNQCVEICNEVAWVHASEGFGIAEKTSGTHGVRYDGQRASIDGLVYRSPDDPSAPEQFIDILGNAEGENPPWAVPAWDVHASSNRRWVRPIRPTGQPVPPEPTPEPEPEPEPPAGDYITRAEFTAYQDQVEQSLLVLRARVGALEMRVTTIEAAPTPAYMLVGDPNAPAIGTSTDVFHTHQFRAAVVPKV
jgi:hypothetical protein